eukprot:3399498-Rhodomonas_salina.1
MLVHVTDECLRSLVTDEHVTDECLRSLVTDEHLRPHWHVGHARRAASFESVSLSAATLLAAARHKQTPTQHQMLSTITWGRSEEGRGWRRERARARAQG